MNLNVAKKACGDLWMMLESLAANRLKVPL
jgi:hypothetical protein